MENKINLTKQLPLITTVLICLIGFSVLVAELIVHFSSNRKKAKTALEMVSTVEPKQVLKTVYQNANNYFVGDSVARLHSMTVHCSKPLVQVFDKTPGIMEYTFARETRNGQLKTVDIVSQEFKGADSAIVNARALYKDGTTKDFKQYFIRESGTWKLGLKYGYDIK